MTHIKELRDELWQLFKAVNAGTAEPRAVDRANTLAKNIINTIRVKVDAVRVGANLPILDEPNEDQPEKYQRSL